MVGHHHERLARLPGSKVVADARAALEGVADGMRIMAGGFGLCGNAEHCITELARRRVRDLTIISNNCGNQGRGLAVLLQQRQVAHVICSFIGGNPDLSVETSDAAQAEVNARIWKGERRIRELSFRVDASYTRIDNLIQVTQGKYSNSGECGIASLELLAKLYVQGNHRLELGYTYLRVDTSDTGNDIPAAFAAGCVAR